MRAAAALRQPRRLGPPSVASPPQPRADAGFFVAVQCKLHFASRFSTRRLLAPAAEPYTAHVTALSAVQFNKVYLTPCFAVPSISVAAASDKRCSLGSQMTPAAALSVARQFHRAFELCRGNGLTAADGKSNVDIPGVVNLAFAIELGLKASHFSYNDAVRGHRLDQLYYALPQLDQEFIAHHSSLGKDKIAADLPHVANAFQDWRYIHEEVGIITISLQFLMLFWHGVDNLAETKRQQQLEALRQSQK